MAEPFTVLKLSETHEWRLRGRRWELHYLPADDGMPLRTASRFEAELLDAAKREVDAASGVTGGHAPCAETYAGCAPDCHAGNRCTPGVIASDGAQGEKA